MYININIQLKLSIKNDKPRLNIIGICPELNLLLILIFTDIVMLKWQVCLIKDSAILVLNIKESCPWLSSLKSCEQK